MSIKLQNKPQGFIPTDYDTFSDHYDKVYSARAGLGKASQFGFDVVRQGDYLEANSMRSQLSNVIMPDFDPRRGPDPMRAEKARRASNQFGFDPYMNVVPEPYPEYEPRQDLRKRRAPKPGFSF